ncbi:MAG: TIGR02302 family protein [Alphaproteobacteria bacterium]
MDARQTDEHVADQLLARALQRAWWTILWERLWPALASLAVAVGVFLAVSWAGLWLVLPPLGRAVALFVLIVLIAVAAVPLFRFRLPSTFDGLRRLDRGSGLKHRPATAIADELAAGEQDQVSQALWRAHVEQALRAANALKAGTPRPRLHLFDPVAVRALVVLLVCATFFAASGERVKRITAAFDWAGVVQAKNFRVDAWVTPPAYTARPPVILPGIRAGEPHQAALIQTVPAGSVLVIRASGASHLDVVTSGGIAEASRENAPAPPAGTVEHRYTITDRGTATLRGVLDEDVTYTFAAIPDRAPTIALTKEPEPQLRGSLQLSYKVEDDYGVIGAQATFALKDRKGPDGKEPRALYSAPDFPLVLPQLRTRSGTAQTTKDLSDHPWAGAEVVLTLTARDEAGNEGSSTPTEFKLPERIFTKPLARALIEQRRILALDAGAGLRILQALDALMIAPDKFTPEVAHYLGLRAIRANLDLALKFQEANKESNIDDRLRDVVARLWGMAVTIEDGWLSDAEAALRQAQEALRQALERGASDEEIKKLTDELRAALDKFMQALAEQMRKNPEQLARPLDRNTRMLRPQDLKSMIDKFEQLARSGAKDAARKMLEELQQMLENLQMARPGQQGGDDMDDDMMSALDELGNMIREQQNLRDKTFRQGQEQRRNQQRGQRGQNQQGRQQGQQGDPSQFGELRQNQQALREQLKKLLEEMRKRGQAGQPQPGQQGQDPAEGLGQADGAMGDAEGQLGEGNSDSAVDSQGRALEALRRGAQSLAQQMQQGQQGPGGPGQPGRNGQARANNDTDPLGRPLRGRDYGDDVTVKVPGEIDVQRARRILEELRKRFADPARPQLELDYIERLLKDF